MKSITVQIVKLEYKIKALTVEYQRRIENNVQILSLMQKKHNSNLYKISDPISKNKMEKTYERRQKQKLRSIRYSAKQLEQNLEHLQQKLTILRSQKE